MGTQFCSTLQYTIMKSYLCLFPLISSIQCCNIWVKSVPNPQVSAQGIRHGKKISTPEFDEANTFSQTKDDVQPSIGYFNWRPVDNNLVEDINYNRVDQEEEPEIITLETIQEKLKSRQFSKIVKSLIT